MFGNFRKEMNKFPEIFGNFRIHNPSYYFVLQESRAA